MINANIEAKLKELPKAPGVYFHKDKDGTIIYVGKAAVLNNRVRQYFQKSRGRDAKTEALVAEIADIDWVVVDSELEALFLEAEMIRRYMPRYNILLRDDKSMAYIRIDYGSDYPTVSTTRRPLDDGARYFGPYLSTLSVRQALKLLRRVFPFATRRTPGQKRATLHYHLGLDPGLEDGKTSLQEYRANLRKLIAVVEGKRKNIEKELEKEMQSYAKVSEFEKAAKARNQLFALRQLNHKVVFSDKEFLDISKDHALNELVDLLGLAAFPQRIEGYDISHQQGSDVVASMVVFTNGATNKAEYRKFKATDRNDDFANMYQTIKRRLTFQGSALKKDKMLHNKPAKNAWKFKIPDLVLIDGGKGQLEAAIRARDESFQGTTLEIPMVGLAKREEQIVIKKVTGDRLQVTATGSNVQLNHKFLQKLGGFTAESDDFILVNLPHSTNLVKLLQRIRDESHRFAVSYHSTLKTKRQTASVLDGIPGIGPATRKKLIRTFGSARALFGVELPELTEAIGSKKATALKRYLHSAPEKK